MRNTETLLWNGIKLFLGFIVGYFLLLIIKDCNIFLLSFIQMIFYTFFYTILDMIFKKVKKIKGDQGNSFLRNIFKVSMGYFAGVILLYYINQSSIIIIDVIQLIFYLIFYTLLDIVINKYIYILKQNNNPSKVCS
jgi:heme O synthase-like polyprenyltransferase